jgi:phage-related protein
LLTSDLPYSVRYFNQAVLDEIECWPVEIVADYARLVELLVEFGPQLRMPHSRAMGCGLFELRPRGREGDARVLYCFFIGRRVMVLHAFIKKSQSVPQRELDFARRRMREAKDGDK